MKVEKTKLEGVLLIVPKVFGDHRGWFAETYNEEEIKKNNIDIKFLQDNHSYSKQKGTLRGIHFQNYPKAQTKLIRCTRGKILDVVVDLRKTSQTYKEWVAYELSAENFHQLLIPKGFGHAFVALTEDVEVQYKVDELYAPLHDRSIRYDDPELGIEWPEIELTLSDKDKYAPLLKDSDINF